LVDLLHQSVRQVKLDACDDDRDQPEAKRVHSTFLLSCISAACAAGAEVAVHSSGLFAFSVYRAKQTYCLLF
jgi:hypothetical protein